MKYPTIHGAGMSTWFTVEKQRKNTIKKNQLLSFYDPQLFVFQVVNHTKDFLFESMQTWM